MPQGHRDLADSAPGLLIVDISLKGTSGLELIKQCRALCMKIPILVLSMHDESLYAERRCARARMATSPSANRRRRWWRRSGGCGGGGVSVGEDDGRGPAHACHGGGVEETSPKPIDRLTDREMEVLEMIGLGRTTREIAATLQLGVATVDTYRARIKEKMNFRNAVELQHFAIRWLREREG